MSCSTTTTGYYVPATTKIVSITPDPDSPIYSPTSYTSTTAGYYVPSTTQTTTGSITVTTTAAYYVAAVTTIRPDSPIYSASYNSPRESTTAGYYVPSTTQITTAPSYAPSANEPSFYTSLPVLDLGEPATVKTSGKRKLSLVSGVE